MLYYLENAELTECKTHGHSCYKPMTDKGKTFVTHRKLRYFPITPRQKKLFMSLKTIEHMTWHQLHDVVNGVMVHLSDGKAWKHFNNVHPYFLVETKNVCLGLCTNRFNPFMSFVALNSCWSVILTVYNLPRGCVWGRSLFFLSMIVPGPNSLGQNIDVCRRPLIDKLKQL
jgi:hypothetical protein